MRSDDPFGDARYVMTACNACGYCHGYCHVFNQSRLLTSFADSDLNYLANLCQDCGACLDACQYAPPHVFDIDVPRSLSNLRHHTYRLYGRPQFVAAFLGRSKYGGFILVLATMLLSAAFFGFVVLPRIPGSGTIAPAFYDVVSWQAMVLMGALTAAGSLIAITGSIVAFWRDVAVSPANRLSFPHCLRALRGILTWRAFGGLSHGCRGGGKHQTFRRKYLHHGLLYGCVSCFAATVIATIYHHILGRPAPYAYTSLPVILGAAGGSAILVSAIGLAVTGRWRSDDGKADASLLPSLFLVAATGLLLLIFRESRAMALLLVLHLGAVAGFFLSLPYGHFLHGPFRGIAMLRAAGHTSTRAELAVTDTSTTRPGSGD